VSLLDRVRAVVVLSGVHVANKNRWQAGIVGSYCTEEYCTKCDGWLTEPRKYCRCFCGNCFFCGKDRRYCRCTRLGILGGICAYCENSHLVMHEDHILPSSVFPGYRSVKENLVLACNNCNSKKGARLPSECFPSSWVVSLEAPLLFAYQNTESHNRFGWEHIPRTEEISRVWGLRGDIIEKRRSLPEYVAMRYPTTPEWPINWWPRRRTATSGHPEVGSPEWFASTSWGQS
jgi:HNH endonuclease